MKYKQRTMEVKFPCGHNLKFTRHIAMNIKAVKNYDAFPCKMCEAKEEHDKFKSECKRRGFSNEERDNMWQNGMRKVPKHRKPKKKPAHKNSGLKTANLPKEKKISWSDRRKTDFKCKQTALTRYLSGNHLTESRGVNSKTVTGFFLDLGYSKDQLKEYFDKCFEFWDLLGEKLERTTYGSKGLWEVDHVRPRAHPRYMDEGITDFQATKDLFSLPNLRPTPKTYNRHKGNFYYGKYYYYDGGTNTYRKRSGKFKDQELKPFIDTIERSFRKFINGEKICDYEWSALHKSYQRFCR